MESQENHSSAAPVPPSTPGAPHWLLSDVHRLAASRAEHCLALVLTASKGHPHSSADCVGWSECQGMRLSSSLIVCKLVFCIQSDSVIRSTPWASALPANPPWKSPWEPQIQKLCLVPPPLGHKSLFSGSQAAILVFSPQSTHLFHAESKFFGSLAGVPFCCVRGNLHIRHPNPTNTSRALQAATDGSRQHNPLNS